MFSLIFNNVTKRKDLSLLNTGIFLLMKSLSCSWLNITNDPFSSLADKNDLPGLFLSRHVLLVVLLAAVMQMFRYIHMSSFLSCELFTS